MAFWKKKGEDPWDIDPAKRKKEAAEAINAPPAEMMCPWCGKEMERGVIHAPEGRIYWQKKPPRVVSPVAYADDALVVDHETSMGTLYYKTTYYCRDCQKMVTDVAGIQPPLPLQKNQFSEYVEQWKAMEEREKQKGET